MSRLPNQYLTALTDRRINQRDRLIRRQGREIARWGRSVEERLLGIIHADRGGREGVTGSVDAFLLGIPISASELLAGKLVEMWDWSWDSAVDIMVRAVPMEVWVARMAPLGVGEGMSDSESLRREHLARAELKRITPPNTELLKLADRFPAPQEWYQEVAGLDFEVEIAPILAGTATPAEARAMVARFEFAAPRADRVEAILRATNAPDGLDAMTRIKTVLPQDLDRLRSTIVSAMSAPDRASAIQALSPQIREMVGGINYKAQRIARTEGMRIAEAGQDECDSQVDDMITGYKAMTAFDANVRREHRVWHDQLYKRITQGRYVHPTLGDLPQFPAGANCRCFKVAQLATSLTQGLPPVQLGGQYGRALARFKRQGLAGFEKRVAPAKRAAKKVIRPKPKKKVPRKKVAPPLRVSPYKKEPIPKPRPKRLPQRSAAEREAIIQKQEQAIAAQKLEQLTAYDQDGNVRFHAFGTKNQVRMTTAQYKSMEGSITLHNHPAGSTFSAADIIGGALRNEAETRVITTRFRFQMKYKDVWGTLNHKERLAKAEALKRVYNAESIKAAKSVVPGIKAGNLTVTQGIEVAGHKLWTVLAEKFDLLYVRTAL